VPVGYNTGVGPSCIVHVGGGLAFVSSSFGEIFRSDDAGARWQKVFDGYAGPLNAFAFADATTGCAAGNYGAILRTTDAGRSWSFASNGLTLPNLDLAMWDRQRGIALADNGFKLRVSDGEAWIPQPYTSGNQQSDVAVCVLPGGFAATCGRTQVHVSQDYGRTWTAKTPVVGGQHGIRFLTPDLGWVVGEALRVTHTDDGGKTWKVQHEIPSRHVLYSIDMLDPTHGWTSGSGGAVLKTTDGRTWQSVPVGLSHPGATQGLLVDFVTPQAGWLVGQFGLIATTANGGGQWTERSLIGFDESFTAITAVSADEAYAAVFNKNTLGSRLLHSTDNGRSWQTVWAGSDSVTRIERSPANELWLCGTRGMIVHREPGGAFEPIGAGCSGSAGVPALSTAQPPRIGATFDLIASRLPAAATSALLMLGVSRTRWSGLDLPLDLAFLGMSGCALRVSRNVMLAAPAAGGTARWLLQVPNSDSLLGQAIHLQALVVDPPANAAGLVVSDAATGWVGR
jgi:photosystem II stability/assembly factor-like uncharacterized protein